MKAIRIESPAALRADAVSWDRLWLRSDVSLPTVRAELLAQWVEHFAPHSRFVAIGVEQAGRLVAALPLVGSRLAHAVPVGQLPSCPWACSGDLLLDRAVDHEAILGCMVEAIRRLPWPLLWLDTIELESPRWKHFRAALARAGLSTDACHQFHIAQIEIDHDWTGYEARWSKSHRRNIRRYRRRLEACGDVELRIYDRLQAADVDELVRQGFEVEDRSWKSEAGTSVLRTPGMLEFFRRQARTLAAWGQLELTFLEHDGWPIAFEFGYQANGIHFAHKAGYDVAYANYSPGKLLTAYQLERYYADRERRLVDCMGVLSDTIAQWATHSYGVGRLAACTGSPMGRALLAGYRGVWPRFREIRRRMRGGEQEATPTKLGAARDTATVSATAR